MLKIALPIALQNLIISALNAVDVIIIGGLGEQAIAAVGLANQYFFLLNLVLFGIASGSAIFTAQYWGNKDLSSIKRILGIALITSVISSALFAITGFLVPEQIIGIFSKDSEVIRLGSGYLRIIVFSYIVTGVTITYSFLLRSTGQIKIPMYISAVALGINTVLNYMLVYGYFGGPAMGINGSALATVIARFIEVTALLSIVYSKKLVVAAKIEELLDISRDFVIKYFKVTTPVIVNEAVWALGVSIYTIVYARMGTEVIASINISSTIERMTWVAFMGIGNACAVMIGNKIGEGSTKEVFDYSKRFLVTGMITGIVAGIIIMTTSRWALSFYNISPLVYDYSSKILIALSLMLWARVINYIIIIGILRSGGDTKIALIVDLGGVWLVGVPMAVIGGLVLKLPVYWVFAMVSLEEVFKLIFGIPRVASKKWVNNLTKG